MAVWPITQSVTLGTEGKLPMSDMAYERDANSRVAMTPTNLKKNRWDRTGWCRESGIASTRYSSSTRPD